MKKWKKGVIKEIKVYEYHEETQNKNMSVIFLVKKLGIGKMTKTKDVLLP